MTAPRDIEAEPNGPQERRADGAAAPAQTPHPPRRDEPADTGPGWAARSTSPQQPSPRESGRPAGPAGGQDPTTVLPSGARRPAAGSRPAAAAGRPATPGARPGARPLAGRSRRARLTLRRIDPWSVFLFSLVASVFIGLAMVVAVAVMYAVLGSLGVTESLNELYAEVTGGDITTDALLTSGRIIGGAAVLAAINVVFLTLLATLSALLYNLCSSFTGGIELTFGERD